MANNLIVSILIKLFKTSICSLAVIHCFLLLSKDHVNYDKKYKHFEIIALILSVIPSVIVWVLIDDFDMRSYNAPSYWLLCLLYLPLLIFIIKKGNK